MKTINAIRNTASHTPEHWYYEMEYSVTTIFAPDPTGQNAYGTYVAEIDGQDVGRFATAEQHEANARRIVATVNACQGLDTEALERGMIAELRHILGELVSAAGDLDAAIYSVTDQFNAERNRLNAALRAAQAILDGGMEIDLHELLAGQRKILAVWCIEDVQAVRPDLTDELAWKVLQLVKRTHDCNYGITWLTLEIAAEELFGYAPETAREEEQP